MVATDVSSLAGRTGLTDANTSSGPPSHRRSERGVRIPLPDRLESALDLASEGVATGLLRRLSGGGRSAPARGHPLGASPIGASTIIGSDY